MELIGTDKKEFKIKLQSLMEVDIGFDELIERTDDMESFFLTVRHARQMWHGAAYSKLAKNPEKKEYRERYKLKQDALNQYSLAVNYMLMTHKNTSPDVFLTDEFPSLTFSHFRLTAPLLKIDFDKGVELLEKAQNEGLTRDQIHAESLDIRQGLTLERRAQTLSKDQTMPIGEARKKVALDDKVQRQNKLADARRKAYQKAKEVVTEYEKKVIVADTNDMTPEEALEALGIGCMVVEWITDDALKTLYHGAAKANHSDKGGKADAMKVINAANEKLQQYVRKNNETTN